MNRRQDQRRQQALQPPPGGARPTAGATTGRAFGPEDRVRQVRLRHTVVPFGRGLRRFPIAGRPGGVPVARSASSAAWRIRTAAAWSTTCWPATSAMTAPSASPRWRRACSTVETPRCGCPPRYAPRAGARSRRVFVRHCIAGHSTWVHGHSHRTGRHGSAAGDDFREDRTSTHLTASEPTAPRTHRSDP